MKTMKSKKRQITIIDFIDKANLKHNNFYDYSKSFYINTSTKLIITCPKHGDFEQLPNSHLSGKGCKACGLSRLASISDSKKKDISYIVNKANLVHNNKYDYSESVYKGYNKPFKVICLEHGEFYPSPANHISNKTGCPKCAQELRKQGLKKNFEGFIVEARSKHGDSYEYKEDNTYIHSRTSVIIICSLHGEHRMSMNSHLNGRGCPSCGIEIMSSKLSLPFEEFRVRADEIYDGQYDYRPDSYKSLKENIVAVCQEHGNFNVIAQSHLYGTKCPQCKFNLFERDIYNYLKSLGLEVSVFDRKALPGLELDFIIDGRLAIEAHGIYWHSYNRSETSDEKRKHLYKHERCKEAGLELIQVYEDEWANRSHIVKSIINTKLGLGNKIFARKCEVITNITAAEARNFLTLNHMQGYKYGLNYGIAYDGKLVSLLVMSRSKRFEWEIARFASNNNTIVVGALSRLFNRFIDEYSPNMVISYADKRYFNGLSYKNINMKNVGCTSPNYRYVKNRQTLSREKFQKHKLNRLLDNYDSNLTEAENMFNNGYRRIWDAGHYRFIWTNL
jgi:hypothetical protein